MNRYCFYIDGFNVYHALNAHACYHKFKWLNYRKLAEFLIGPKDIITGIFYFSAIATWRSQQSINNHKNYIKVLQGERIELIQGRFMKKKAHCPLCKRFFPTHEEKRTDVNIALKILCDTFDDLYDKAIIVSADSDLLPVIQSVRKYAPEKKIGVMLPIGRSSSDLRQNADFRLKMTQKRLQANQFPDSVILGNKTINRPSNWC